MTSPLPPNSSAGPEPIAYRSRAHELFHRFAQAVARAAGSVGAFVGAVGVIIIWLITGPIYSFSDTWQLVINTGTSVMTFLMVFLIQNTQNRDSRITQLKLDELLRAIKAARTSLVQLADLSDEELLKVEKEFQRLGKRAKR
jgi:low affinity Fe/Cu permease